MKANNLIALLLLAQSGSEASSNLVNAIVQQGYT